MTRLAPFLISPLLRSIRFRQHPQDVIQAIWVKLNSLQAASPSSPNVSLVAMHACGCDTLAEACSFARRPRCAALAPGPHSHSIILKNKLVKVHQKTNPELIKFHG